MSEHEDKINYKVLFIGLLIFSGVISALYAIQLQDSARIQSASADVTLQKQVIDLRGQLKQSQYNGTADTVKQSRIAEAYALEAYFCGKQSLQDQTWSDGSGQFEGMKVHAFLQCGTDKMNQTRHYEMVYDRMTNQLTMLGEDVQ